MVVLRYSFEVELTQIGLFSMQIGITKTGCDLFMYLCVKSLFGPEFSSISLTSIKAKDCMSSGVINARNVIYL